MQRVFISDLHLQDRESPAFERFVECLQRESEQVDEIFILGDLVEMWVGDDDDSPGSLALIDALASTQSASIFLMHGNRDFLFGEQFATATGVKLISDPYCTLDGVLLSHGDALCVDDIEYQNMRKLLRSPEWQADILGKTLAERQAFGAGLRAQSKQGNANKPANIMDVNATAVTELMAEHQAHTLIHGHTHRPGVHRSEAFTRIVTGSWENCGWLVRQIDNSFQLESFSLARRYGT